MKPSTYTLDSLMARYVVAPADKQQAALAAAIRILDGQEEDQKEERYLSLQELAAALGYKGVTQLHRLEINAPANRGAAAGPVTP